MITTPGPKWRGWWNDLTNSVLAAVYNGTQVLKATASTLQVPEGVALTTGDITISDGGTVTQASSATTGVTLNTHVGQITTVAQNIAAAGEVTFTVTNSKVAATSTVIANIASGASGGTPIVSVTAVAAGSFSLTLTNLHASAAEVGTLVINFAVIKGSAT